MKINLDPKSRLVAATKILSRLGVELNVKSVAREITRSRVRELEVLGAEEANAITDVLSSLEAFDDIVREQVREMRTAERYEVVRGNFKSILDDAERMVNQVSDDGKLSVFNKMQNRLMEWRRGSIQSRFSELRNVSEQVFADIDEQIKREMTVLEAYREFRTGLKEATLVGVELQQRAEKRRDEFAKKLEEAQNLVNKAKEEGQQTLVVGRYELDRDQAQREFEMEDRRYQSALDVSEQLNIAYGIAEAVMQKLQQTTEVKDAQQRKTATFYTANTGTLTALMAAFTSIKGLHEGTMTHQAMVDGTNDALSRLSNLGTKAQENALKVTYGATLDAQNLRKMYESVVSFEESQRAMITDLRAKSKKNDEEVRRVIEEGQRRMAEAVSKRHSANKSSAITLATEAVQDVVVEGKGLEIDVQEVSPLASLQQKRMEAEADASPASPTRGARM